MLRILWRRKRNGSDTLSLAAKICLEPFWKCDSPRCKRGPPKWVFALVRRPASIVVLSSWPRNNLSQISRKKKRENKISSIDQLCSESLLLVAGFAIQLSSSAWSWVGVMGEHAARSGLFESPPFKIILAELINIDFQNVNLYNLFWRQRIARGNGNCEGSDKVPARQRPRAWSGLVSSPDFHTNPFLFLTCFLYSFLSSPPPPSRASPIYPWTAKTVWSLPLPSKKMKKKFFIPYANPV